MFDRIYPFKYIQSKKVENEPFTKEHLYTFKGKNGHRYIVVLQEFPFQFIGIKFHLKAHTDSPNKYKLLTRNNDVQGCVRTCIEIMLSLLSKNKKTSYGFIGANLVGENMNNTKRFKIYRQVMENLFSPLYFTHYSLQQESVYLMLNNIMLKEHPRFFQLIKKSYIEHYRIEKPEEDASSNDDLIL